MPSLIFQIVSWPALGIALLVFGFAPGAVLRLIVLAFPRDDPRRRELRGELYAIPRIERPFWVIEQLEVALFEGLRGRFAGRTSTGASDVAMLVQRVAAGDYSAWKPLVNRYGAVIPAMARLFPLWESEVSDDSQATWLRLLKDIDRLKATGEDLWLEVTTRNETWLMSTNRWECVRRTAARLADGTLLGEPRTGPVTPQG